MPMSIQPSCCSAPLYPQGHTRYLDLAAARSARAEQDRGHHPRGDQRHRAQEVHFPALLPREPYEATHRWEEYGDNIFRLKDRHEADYLLAPTHEEMFTLLVKDMYSSYKDLPRHPVPDSTTNDTATSSVRAPA